MQAYRGLPILTNQPERPTALVGIWPLDYEGSVAEFQRLAHAAIDAVLARRSHAYRCRRHRPLPAGRTRRSRPAARAASRGARALGAPLRRGGRRSGSRHAGRARSRGGRARPPERPPAGRPGARARGGGSVTGPERSRLWTDDTRHPTLVFGLDVPDASSSRDGSTSARRRCSSAGWRRRCARALAQPLSSTARKVIGLEELATLPREEAIAAVALKTRQYAAYQRKWLRRLPGVVSVRADRPPDAVADEILEVARARQRLPARRAG